MVFEPIDREREREWFSVLCLVSKRSDSNRNKPKTPLRTRNIDEHSTQHTYICIELCIGEAATATESIISSKIMYTKLCVLYVHHRWERRVETARWKNRAHSKDENDKETKGKWHTERWIKKKYPPLSVVRQCATWNMPHHYRSKIASIYWPQIDSALLINTQTRRSTQANAQMRTLTYISTLHM